MTILDDAINDVCHLRRRLDEVKRERGAAITRAEKAEAERNALAEDLWRAEDQWGDDYLWKKWNLSKHLTNELKNELAGPQETEHEAQTAPVQRVVGQCSCGFCVECAKDYKP